MALFDKDGLARIEAKIGEVEAKTAAEIVVVTVPRSDGYRDVRVLFSSSVGFVAASVVQLVWHDFAATWVLLVLAGAALAAWLLSGVPFVLRQIVPGTRAQHEVERAAELSFLEHEVFDTRDRNGLVIFLSELEHRVTLLGDSGIHALLKDEGFVPLVEQLARAIRDGRAAEGTCEVIERVGAVLAESSPAKSDNPDELDNRVRVGR